MNPVRVMVVDDDAFAREVIVAILSEDDGIQVVGQAANGREAVEKAARLKPNLVTMDIEMPDMDGLEAIRRIMRAHAAPILVVTGTDDARLAYEAVSRGALEVVAKPSMDQSLEFRNKIKFLSKIKVISHILKDASPEPPQAIDTRRNRQSPPGVVAIAASTGGPKALAALLAALPEGCLPIVVAQHITKTFAPGLVKWLDSLCRLTVKIGEPGEPLAAGRVYVSPADRHIAIDRRKCVAFEEHRPGDIYFPSCDVLLTSAATAYGPNAAGVILTGMGTDGLKGIRAIKAAGGATIAQDESSSAVYGMPKAAAESGAVDQVLPLSDIPGWIVKWMKCRNAKYKR